MAISRSKKEATVEKLKTAIAGATTVVFVHFDKVTSEEANALRGVCDHEGVGYLVAKKTLIRRAFEQVSFEGVLPDLDGEVAVAYGADMLTPARVMGEQAETLKDRFFIIGGVFEDAFVSPERMRIIASIPPVEILYAQFLMVIRSPVQGLVRALSQIAEKK